MAINLPTFPEFDLQPRETVPTRFEKYHKRLNNLFAAMGIEEAPRKKAMLLHYVGEDVCDIFDTLTVPAPEPDTNGDVYKSAVKAISNTLNHKSVLTTMCITFEKKRRDRMRKHPNSTPGCSYLLASVNLHIIRSLNLRQTIAQNVVCVVDHTRTNINVQRKESVASFATSLITLRKCVEVDQLPQKRKFQRKAIDKPSSEPELLLPKKSRREMTRVTIVKNSTRIMSVPCQTVQS